MTKLRDDYKTYFALEAQLKLHESYEAFPYVDSVGKITIGIGHNLTDRGVSERVIEQMFEEDVEVAEKDLDKIFGEYWRSLSEKRRLVLLDMSFNMGYDRLSKFYQTIQYIKDGMFEEAAVQMRKTKWAKQVKGRATRLSKMMEEG